MKFPSLWPRRQRRLIAANLCNEQRRHGWTGTDIAIAERLLEKFIEEHITLPAGKRQEVCPHLDIENEDADAHMAFQCAHYLAYCARGAEPLPTMQDFVTDVLDSQAGRVQ